MQQSFIYGKKGRRVEDVSDALAPVIVPAEDARIGENLLTNRKIVL